MSARTPEGRLTAKIIAHLNAQPQTIAHKVHVGAYASSGEPDVDCVQRGRAVKLEVKTPGTEAQIRRRVTALQRRRLLDYVAAGAVAAVVTSVDEVALLLDADQDPAAAHDNAAALDAIRARIEIRPTNQGDSTMAKAATTQPRTNPTVRYYRDGKPVTDSVNKLSTIAYHFTRKIESPDSKRMSSGAFRALLGRLGVTEPETTTWHVRLPNGIAIGAVAPGDKLPPAPAEAKAGRTTKAPTATKAAPAKRSTTTKAKRQQPAKGAGAKRATAKASTSKRTRTAA